MICNFKVLIQSKIVLKTHLVLKHPKFSFSISLYSNSIGSISNLLCLSALVALPFCTGVKLEKLLFRIDKALITVFNRGVVLPRATGSKLPEKDVDSLFQQLVSYRSQGDDKPHLGLGLFIARLITEYHGGTI